ncbi:MAG TPA: M28 family metallopeptidase [Candidatus Acidoferrales bacterium]|nr:M28 family metallopeptidase [Candidatus Acidoferrales bacterium]
MKRTVVLGLVSAVALALPALTQERQMSLDGYSADSARNEIQWEQKFRAMPSADNMREAMRRLTLHPHHVGSPYDKDNAEWLLAQFKQYGWDAHIESFNVLFPTPKERTVELVEPTKFVAKLQEPPVSGDPTSGQQSEQLPSYNAYSIDGDVTAPLVYVNYGAPADYEELDRHGVSVKGAIVIARYGQTWRGIKPKVAGEHGAIGCIIYSDPRDDGYFEGGVFPDGPYRPKDGVQRGSVADMPLYPGDPLTPGVGSKSDAKTFDIKDAKTLTTIPVLPISYADAQPLLEALRGSVAPPAWRGGLPITYHIGPGPAKVHLKVKSNWDLKPVYDVIAKIAGATEPDEWVIRGNHHDAWVNGADDPISGQVSLLEEARAMGELVKAGWKPKRTIIYCAWDGEEPGLLGSTEWAETHADELKQHAVVYINSDNSSRGFLNASGSHSLEPFINDIARSITDPEKNISVWQRDQLRRSGGGGGRGGRGDAAAAPPAGQGRGGGNFQIGALGSGSDYTVYLDFLGIASMDLRYGGEGSSAGVYHSIYDDFYWFTHFSDPNFIYCRALSQTIGTAVIRMADADLLPYDFNALTATVRRYETELETLAQTERDQIIERNRQIDDKVFDAMADPQETYVPPAREDVPPFFNFAPLRNALETLAHSSERYGRAHSRAMQNGGAAIASASLADVNMRLLHCERALTDDKGLPGRPWFKHMLYAPGFYTGYGVKTIPAVREAIEQKQWDRVSEQIPRVSVVLEKEAAAIDAASAALEQAIH